MRSGLEGARPKTILVVEDGRFMRVSVERMRVRAGYKVVTVSDGDEALRVAAKTPPDLVLLDMLLPRLSGPEVLRSLRTTPQTAAVPIGVLSRPDGAPRTSTDRAWPFQNIRILSLGSSGRCSTNQNRAPEAFDLLPPQDTPVAPAKEEV